MTGMRTIITGKDGKDAPDASSPDNAVAHCKCPSSHTLVGRDSCDGLKDLLNNLKDVWVIVRV